MWGHGFQKAPNGLLGKDFTLAYSWRGGGDVSKDKIKVLPARVVQDLPSKKAGGKRSPKRWDYWCYSPLEGVEVRLVRLAAQVKFNKTKVQMKDLLGDRNSKRGWPELRWKQVKIRRKEEPDPGSGRVLPWRGRGSA